MEQIRNLALSGAIGTPAAISKVVGLETVLVKECLTLGDDEKQREAWCRKATASLQKRAAARSPHLHVVGHLILPARGGVANLDLLDANGHVLASCKRSVAPGTAPKGELADAGPFALVTEAPPPASPMSMAQLSPSKRQMIKAEMTGSITVHRLEYQPPPEPRTARAASPTGSSTAPAPESTGAEKDTEASDDEEAPVSTGCAKKDALRDCLAARALEQGDYVTLLRRVEGVNVEEVSLAETLEWVNKTIATLWPHVDAVVRKVCYETVLPKIRAAVPGIGPTINFERVSLGDRPLALGPISVREVGQGTSWDDDDGLEISLGINFDSAIDLKLTCAVASVGVKELNFNGTLNVVLRALNPEPPFIGGVEVCFANPPTLSMDLLGIGNLAEMPGINSILRNVIDNGIAGVCVVPNRIGISLNKALVSQASLTFPQPEGIMRFTLIKGDDLAAADVNMFGKKSSDPYVVVKVGAQEWHSPIQKKTLNPVWKTENRHDFLVYTKTQHVSVNCFDWDKVSADDSLGMCRKQDVRKLITERITKLALEDDAGKPVQGSLTMQAEWLELTADLAEGHAGRLFCVRIDSIGRVPDTFLEHGPLVVRCTVGGVTKQTDPGGANPDETVDPAKLRESILRLNRDEGMDNAEVAAMLCVTEEQVKTALWLEEAGSRLFKQPKKQLEQDLAVVQSLKDRGVPALEKAEKALQDEIAGTSATARQVASWESSTRNQVLASMALRSPHWHRILYIIDTNGATRANTVLIEVMNRRATTVLSSVTVPLPYGTGHVDPTAENPHEVKVPGPFKCTGLWTLQLEGSLVVRGVRATE
eukprot:TRINITY_DN13664_c0_g2_i1.p1 TRINITY_DN13664_c0_g2~~TRINITY_DN13664_c0_g2_i1.p1  ORF type:complete len:850 (+),score=225.29 TRINITY_DN13664_c0_g2_i1:85-2550(+)